MRAKNNLYRGLFILWLLPFLACGPGTNNSGESTQDGGSNTQKENLTPDATSSEKTPIHENNCTNRCSEGTKQCAKDGPQTCELQANGCTDWSAATPCPTGHICDAGSCVSNCTNRCSEGTKQCAKHGIAFVDIMPVSRRRGGEVAMMADDGLHPSGALYAEWTALALPLVRDLVSATSDD